VRTDVGARRRALLPPAIEARTSPCNAEHISHSSAVVAAIIPVGCCIFNAATTPAGRCIAHLTAVITAILRVGRCIARLTAVITTIPGVSCCIVLPTAVNTAVRVVGPGGLSTGLRIARSEALSANNRKPGRAAFPHISIHACNWTDICVNFHIWRWFRDLFTLCRWRAAADV
jgi:hypothetical protein